ncbi:LysE family translocator [Magnetovibrio blakemorei]|uniref:Lysine transporter LysE n=1 Tax=Magnetovibrio blakemorei TaxID=28181 RepID=A0A1E5Q8X8_9PROT|nr:LysE family translocator [Magnetovibrio blakemorei]OEJ67912.1 hypothetical protein BEN30_07900 [Magnetovibrio blakemorei]
MGLFDQIIPLIVFCATAVFTPGPNNVMVTASGVNFGFVRTVPHILGIAVGFALMNLMVGLGLGSVFEMYPQIHVVLKYVGIAYLVFLAWKIATSGEVKGGKARAKPFTFLQAAAFQWVNPKAWAIAVGAVATFTTLRGDLLVEVAVMSAIFFLVTFPSAGTWAVFGLFIGRFLHTPGRLKAFNWFMAGLLLLSIIPAVV